jgi:predicted phage tail protein
MSNADRFKNRSGNVLQNSVVSKNQLVSCVDIISEGPIHGLVNGAASIYLDNNPAADKSKAAKQMSSGIASFAFQAGSTTVTPTNVTLESFTASGFNGSRYLRMQDMRVQSGANAVRNSTTDHIELTVTAASAFFESWMVKDDTAGAENQPYIKLDIGEGNFFTGHIVRLVSTTVVQVVPVGGVLSNMYADKTSGEYTIKISGALSISTIANNEITLLSSANVETGTFQCDLSHSIFYSSFVTQKTISDTSNYKGFSYQFMPGTLSQECLNDLYTGRGSTTITATFTGENFVINDSGNTWPSTTGATAITKTSSDMNLSVSTARQVDEVRVLFGYSGLISNSTSTDNSYPVVQAYRIEININKGSGFGGWVNYNADSEYFYHVAKQKTGFYIQEKLDLNRFKPFTDFKLRFTKATRDDVGVQGDGSYDNDYNVTSTSVLSSTVCVLKEKLNHPWTALAQVTVDAEHFSSVPKRSYLCRGRLIAVPSNYVTREESFTGIANHKRIPSSGAIHATIEQDWDGKFRGRLVYTDNPAWVFYDIISNNRYGLGTWLKKDDIDKYSLYRIARYCDELVPDGKGGTEPRFRANIYLTKGTDSYKVLKDMATTFRSILYWSEGSILPVVDQDKDPVYNFTKGNVIDGTFSYEGTGAKLRSNQVVVTWNNPENDYVPEALLVEDRQNIVKTGKILQEEAVAFGATSIGQATRYGRWKLWTAINQSEVVTFATAINAVFLAPGDIINIQDADRYNITYSGRVSNTGTTRTLTSIPLDRSIILLAGSTYELSVLLEDPVAFLGQDSATILVGSTNTDYERGGCIRFIIIY